MNLDEGKNDSTHYGQVLSKTSSSIKELLSSNLAMT